VTLLENTMKIARIKTSQGPCFATIEGDQFHLLEGQPFEDIRPTGGTIPFDESLLLAPVDPRQIVAIGANYRKHCIECNVPIPDRPVVFLKAVNSLAAPGDAVVLPRIAPDEVDWEAELAIVIGKPTKNIEPADVHKHILGVTCANDISARDVQIKQDKLWDRGKSFDTFCPLGPWIETQANYGNLGIKLTLNGRVMQDARTDDMIFDVPFLVSYLSKCMTLFPGSVVLTGTPWGVGMGRTPAMYLKAGDVMTVEIEGVGPLTNPVVLES
jgi:2-keto-4-pentenoate hydratase/2-oxohepta-3-ene-1,7-dioic acid hydratase in catechol pathway